MNYVDRQFKNIIKKYKPSSVDDLVSKSHCKILYADLEDGTGGCTVTSKRCQTIIVNDNWDQARQQFVIMHEFSHVKLHKSISTPFFRSLSLDHFVSQSEREANQMALKLLIHMNKDDLCGLTKYQILDYLGLPHKFERFFSIEY